MASSASGGPAAAQAFWQRREPVGIGGLQVQQFLDRIAPALWAAAAIGGRRVRVTTVTGSAAWRARWRAELAKVPRAQHVECQWRVGARRC